MRIAAALASLLMLASACSSPDGSSSGRAALTVRLTADLTGGSYIEGFIPYVRVDEGGRPLFDERMKAAGDLAWETSAALQPGRYRVTTYVRPCDGNCGLLDPRADRCSLEIAPQPGSDVNIAVLLKPLHGCTMTER